MKCEKCGAPEVYVKIMMQDHSSGKSKEVNVCEKCFRTFISEKKVFDNKIDPEKVLSLFNSMTKKLTNDEKTMNRYCPRCGTTELEIQKNNRSGCDECFVFFREELEMEIFKLTGDFKIKNSFSDKENRKDLLQNQLIIALEKEEYELAAKIRDSIKSLELRHDK
ncbi:MAG: UvrB/UvrC motif-containing protein [Candidatus Delongbacteria bacterium]|nr:UvrB/UvrC motif-containing protein [Candidatus Delongbacteria bacterium]MBN2836249.1 UvrB/UvrC motif-containing protein [Candidatus Delongbacteria bacterium]